jgi:hypothetical protein
MFLDGVGRFAVLMVLIGGDDTNSRWRGCRRLLYLQISNHSFGYDVRCIQVRFQAASNTFRLAHCSLTARVIIISLNRGDQSTAPQSGRWLPTLTLGFRLGRLFYKHQSF